LVYVMSESCPSSSSRSGQGLQENLPDVPGPRWQRGCHRKYSGLVCKVADCPHLHDLNPEEAEQFLLWKQHERQHVVFSSRSNTNSNTTTTSSRSGGDGQFEGNSIAELIESAALIPSLGPERQQLTRRLRQHFIHINDAELTKLLPQDDAGRVTSIGGLLHESGRCRPCRDLLAGQVCGKGMRCGFCHYPHEPAPTSVVHMDMDLGDKKTGRFASMQSTAGEVQEACGKN